MQLANVAQIDGLDSRMIRGPRNAGLPGPCPSRYLSYMPRKSFVQTSSSCGPWAAESSSYTHIIDGGHMSDRVPGASMAICIVVGFDTVQYSSHRLSHCFFAPQADSLRSFTVAAAAHFRQQLMWWHPRQQVPALLLRRLSMFSAQVGRHWQARPSLEQSWRLFLARLRVPGPSMPAPPADVAPHEPHKPP